MADLSRIFVITLDSKEYLEGLETAKQLLSKYPPTKLQTPLNIKINIDGSFEVLDNDNSLT